MADQSFPDRDGWTMIVETTFDGGSDPTKEDTDAALQAEEDDDLGDTLSKNSDFDEGIDNASVTAGMEYVSFEAQSTNELTFVSKAPPLYRPYSDLSSTQSITISSPNDHEQ